MAEVINEKNAAHEVSQIVKYMTGVDLNTVSPEDRDKPGTHRALPFSTADLTRWKKSVTAWV